MDYDSICQDLVGRPFCTHHWSFFSAVHHHRIPKKTKEKFISSMSAGPNVASVVGHSGRRPIVVAKTHAGRRKQGTHGVLGLIIKSLSRDNLLQSRELALRYGFRERVQPLCQAWEETSDLAGKMERYAAWWKKANVDAGVSVRWRPPLVVCVVCAEKRGCRGQTASPRRCPQDFRGDDCLAGCSQPRLQAAMQRATVNICVAAFCIQAGRMSIVDLSTSSHQRHALLRASGEHTTFLTKSYTVMIFTMHYNERLK